MKRALVVAVVLAVLAPASKARARPSDRNLVLAGMAMAAPTYFSWVIIHEGSHAIGAKLFGAEITKFVILPGRHPVNKRFYFGYVQWRGHMSTGQRIFVRVAPKLSNLLYLGTYSALLYYDALPSNHYAQLAFTVFATGALLDFTKDLALFWTPADVNVALREAGRKTFWQQLPWRIVHLGLAAAAGYAVWRGYQKVFENEPVAVPLLQGRF